MKVLFVTHDIGLYGASKSLGLLIKSLKDDVDCSLLINKRLFGKNDLGIVSERFGIDKEKIFQAHLPFMLCEVGKPKKNIYWIVKQFLWKRNEKKVLNFLADVRFNMVHLNSIVLYPLLKAENSSIIHIREIYDESEPSIFNYLKKAAAFIFIDEATKKPFDTVSEINQRVIANPFDQEKLEKYVTSPPLEYEKLKNKIVYSLIGIIKPTKGQLFVIESFIRANKQNCVLLIVGKSTDHDYFKKCKEAAADAENIIFWGEETEIDKVYYLSDIIVRSEGYPCIGRTVFEGIFSDCRIILQGTRDDYSASINEFDEKITFYNPRCTESFIRALEKTANEPKQLKSKFLSNTKTYGSEVKLFLEKILSNNK